MARRHPIQEGEHPLKRRPSDEDMSKWIRKAIEKEGEADIHAGPRDLRLHLRAELNKS